MNDFRSGDLFDSSESTSTSIGFEPQVLQQQSHHSKDFSKLGKFEVGYRSRTRVTSPHVKTAKELYDATVTDSSLLDKRIAKSRLLNQ
jgi:hypothetical protein